ncbi:MAG: nucleoside kinase [Spirochaetaceae bacterium]|nr:MAG: nucleoside kinase [Spirochaetaceae bacterium]
MNQYSTTIPDEIVVEFPTGQTARFAVGTPVSSVLDFFRTDRHPVDDEAIAVAVNNEITSLTYPVDTNATVRPITLRDPEGVRIYRRSLCFLASAAIAVVDSDRRIVIGHSLGDGYVYYSEDDSPIEASFLKRLEETMRELTDADLAIVRRVMSYTDALAYFTAAGQRSTIHLLEHNNHARIPVHSLGAYTDLSHGPVVPTTGILRYFEIKPYPPGFILRYPPESDPTAIRAFRDSELLSSIYQEYRSWGKILGIRSVGDLNNHVVENRITEFVRVAETLHNNKIAEIAGRIARRGDEVRIVLIAGPSSSGKTTFTKKLAIQLQVIGFRPVTINLDDYFVPRELTPLDENGRWDFESINAIDIALLNEHLLGLFDGKAIEIPSFDFKTGSRREGGRSLTLPNQSILLMEGIHGLNPKLTPRIEQSTKYTVYVSALTQLNIDDHNRISTTDNRLIRRLVRDHQFRGHDALTTLTMWPSVRRGENRNIFPFQDTADSAFNSALDYELGVLKNYASPILKHVKPHHDVYNEATRLLRFLENFVRIPEKIVPSDSILREFIGDSGFKY